MASLGRRPVLDELKKREIVALLSVGCTRSVTAKFVGCAASTIRCTALRDEEFGEAIRKAEVQHEVKNLQHIQEAGKKNWRAASWMLERHYPQRYARRAAEAIAPEQVLALLAMVAEIIATEVPEARYRKRIYGRLERISKQLKSAATKKTKAKTTP